MLVLFQVVVMGCRTSEDVVNPLVNNQLPALGLLVVRLP